MRPIRKDFADLMVYLGTEYNCQFSDEHIGEIKQIHKILWIIIIWRRYLENHYYDDIVLNVLSLIHVSVHKDINIMNFLLRKSIEDFIRFMGIYIVGIRDSFKVSDAFDMAFDDSENDKFLHTKWEILKSVYSECSQTVHSNEVIENQAPCSCLMNYDVYYSVADMSKSVNEWKKVTKCFCNIIIISDIDLFKRMLLNDQAIIRDYLFSDDLRVIFSRL